jgi:hypothetical protein
MTRKKIMPDFVCGINLAMEMPMLTHQLTLGERDTGIMEMSSILRIYLYLNLSKLKKHQLQKLDLHVCSENKYKECTEFGLNGI